MLLTILFSLFFLAKMWSPKISENRKLDLIDKVDTYQNCEIIHINGKVVLPIELPICI